jgi:hypothetical protein
MALVARLTHTEGMTDASTPGQKTEAAQSLEVQLKGILGLSKLLWTALGATHLLILILVLARESAEAFHLSAAFEFESYRSRGGLFLVLPFLAAVVFIFSYKIPGLLYRAHVKTSGGDPTRISPVLYFKICLLRAAVSELVTFFGVCLAVASSQAAFIVPFAVAGIVSWLRAYPTRVEWERFLHSDF